mmetsp:Transcript_29892/g.86914  ORF Transcript_29892/g.86914 Transcript_29892/m.86914 type:complete len:214 (+) Transcript_29892:87-728(+)
MIQWATDEHQNVPTSRGTNSQSLNRQAAMGMASKIAPSTPRRGGGCACKELRERVGEPMEGADADLSVEPPASSSEQKTNCQRRRLGDEAPLGGPDIRRRPGAPLRTSCTARPNRDVRKPPKLTLTSSKNRRLKAVKARCPCRSRAMLLSWISSAHVSSNPCKPRTTSSAAGRFLACRLNPRCVRRLRPKESKMPWRGTSCGPKGSHARVRLS